MTLVFISYYLLGNRFPRLGGILRYLLRYGLGGSGLFSIRSIISFFDIPAFSYAAFTSGFLSSFSIITSSLAFPFVLPSPVDPFI